MNVPEIVDRLQKFDFHVSLDIRQIPPAHNAADDIASVRIGKDDRLPNGQIIRGSKDCSVIEHDDGPALFPNRLGQATRFGRQTSDGDCDFQTNGIGTGRLACHIVRILG
jgi:hypothetical protein